MQPIVRELIPAPDVIETFQRFRFRPGCLLLDSAMRPAVIGSHPLGRFSYLLADPFDWIEHPVDHAAPWVELREGLQRFKLENIPDLPPLQGGYAGLLSYDLNRSLEPMIPATTDEFGLPALALAGYDTLIAWDHHQHRAWLMSSGLPESNEELRTHVAQTRMEQWLHLLKEPPSTETGSIRPATGADSFGELERGRLPLQSEQFSVPGPAGLTSNFSAESYLTAAQKCVDYIHAGDIFQVNLAQRLMMPACCPASQLYLALRECNPATFSAYFDTSRIAHRTGMPFQIISASPERFLAVREGVVETRPIKGTRRRTGVPMVDIHAQDQLIASPKDRAENLMIVDLMRNDLSRCCDDHSVVVTQLCELESYPSVFHLVSAIQGRLRAEADLIDLIEAVFPGGSITGAPKHRAMQIIGELEPNARGAYCGSLGYFGFNGAADFSILIRTITACGGWWQIPVGGGIVSNSKPKLEYEETWAKAAGLLRGVEACRALQRSSAPLGRGHSLEGVSVS